MLSVLFLRKINKVEKLMSESDEAENFKALLKIDRQIVAFVMIGERSKPVIFLNVI